MISKKKYYYHSYNSYNKLIHINNAKKGGEYTCINCGGEMILKQGSKRAWHFAHKHLTSSCNYETYLHKLAKEKFKEWFDSSEEIIIELPSEELCSKIDKCYWFKSDDIGCCIKKSTSKFNLKTYYNQCNIEKSCGEYIADMLLTNNTKQIEPILLEIYVTHRCSENKLKSKFRIIEVQISSEEDIFSFMNGNKFSYEEDNVSLYNFKTPKKSFEQGVKPLCKFILHHSHKAIVIQTDCKNYAYNEFIPKFSATFCCSANGEVYREGLCLAKHKGYDVRNCFLCKYHKDNNYFYDTSDNSIFCCLYKKLGFDKTCKPSQAIDCKSFRFDKEISHTVIKSIPCKYLCMESLDE